MSRVRACDPAVYVAVRPSAGVCLVNHPRRGGRTGGILAFLPLFYYLVGVILLLRGSMSGDMLPLRSMLGWALLPL